MTKLLFYLTIYLYLIINVIYLFVCLFIYHQSILSFIHPSICLVYLYFISLPLPVLIYLPITLFLALSIYLLFYHLSIHRFSSTVQSKHIHLHCNQIMQIHAKVSFHPVTPNLLAASFDLFLTSNSFLSLSHT